MLKTRRNKRIWRRKRRSKKWGKKEEKNLNNESIYNKNIDIVRFNNENIINDKKGLNSEKEIKEILIVLIIYSNLLVKIMFLLQKFYKRNFA